MVVYQFLGFRFQTVEDMRKYRLHVSPPREITVPEEEESLESESSSPEVRVSVGTIQVQREPIANEEPEEEPIPEQAQ